MTDDPGELPEDTETPPADVPTSNPDGDVIAQPDPEDDPEFEHVSPKRVED